MSQVTQIISRIESGDYAASDELLPLVYQELRKLAEAKLANEKPGQTLQATAIVHEAYVRLVAGSNPQQWENSRHFFSAAAESMPRLNEEDSTRPNDAGSRDNIETAWSKQWSDAHRQTIRCILRFNVDCGSMRGIQRAAIVLDPNISDVEDTVNAVASSLLSRTKENDHASWDLLVDFYAPLVYSWCRKRGLTAEQARNIGQEVFASVANGTLSFDQSATGNSFRDWIHQITENRIDNLGQKASAVQNAQNGMNPPSKNDQVTLCDPGGDPIGESGLQEDGAVFLRILDFAKDRIAPDHWNVFWQLMIEHRSPADVAEDAGIELARVFLIKSRIMKLLRTLGDGADS